MTEDERYNLALRLYNTARRQKWNKRLQKNVDEVMLELIGESWAWPAK